MILCDICARRPLREQGALLSALWVLGLGFGMTPLAGARSMSAAERVQSTSEGLLPNGAPIRVHTLRNKHGMVARFSDYGATILEISVPDRKGVMANVVLGSPSLEAYLGGFPAASVVGRFANRIRNGRFMLEGREVQVTRNAGPHHIHGGVQNFSRAGWESSTHAGADAASVTFRYHSHDLEEGFPGNMDVAVTYTLDDGNSLTVEYEARTDATTVVNLTNHAYFNLAGGGDVLGHELQIHATQYTVADAALLPTGELAPVKDTPLDFTSPHRIGERIKELYPAPRGYDHNYVIEGPAGELRPAAKITEPKSGRVMECFTTQPGMQLYTANHFDGRPYPLHGAFCFETQHYPDSPNHLNFPTTTLTPLHPFKSTTRFRFSVAP